MTLAALAAALPERGRRYLEAALPPIARFTCVLLLLGGCARAVYGQGTPADVRYTFALVGVPLADALERLIDETQLSLIYASERMAGRTTYCKAERVPAEVLLACILEGTGFDFVRLSSGTYVLIAEPRTAPRYATLTGLVRDAATGRPLADANILLAGEDMGTATNRDGRFAFAMLRPGPHRLVVTHVAYHARADTVFMEPDGAGRIEVALAPRVVLTAPVVVSGFAGRLPSDDLGLGRRQEDEALRPMGLGTADVVQDLHAVVGVRLGEALSEVHVQGGDANEQQFLLDGIPVFMPVSNGGFIGPFSPFAVSQVTVRKAGFGAAHGSGLSGVIEVEQRAGPSGGPALTLQIDPVGLNGRWMGHAGRPEGVEATWMVAARKGLWDVYQPARLNDLFRRWAVPDYFLLAALQSPGLEPILSDSARTVPEGPLEVGFNDLHAAAHLRLGGLRSLHLSLYQGRNRFGIDDGTLPSGEVLLNNEDAFEDAYRWRNRTGQLRYEWVQNRRLFLHADVWASSYRLAHPVTLGDAGGSGVSVVTSEDFNDVAEVGLRLGGDGAVGRRHQVSAALEAMHTDSDFSVSVDPFGTLTASPSVIRPVTWRSAAFLEDRITLNQRTLVALGTRLTYLPAQQTLFAEPRLALQYDHPAGRRGTWALRTAVGLYRQYLHAFDVATYNVTSLLPRVRFWLPIGQDQRPPEAYHATAAFLYRPDDAWQFSLETYYKHQPHLLVLDYGRRTAAASDEDLLTDADGYAYGLAVTTSRQRERLQFDLQYEYAVARRRVANRFDGAFVPVPWDVPHRLYLAIDQRLSRQWTVTLRWQGLFGRTWGLRQAYYDYLEPNPEQRRYPPFDLSDPAAHRLPAFSQWDAGLTYTRTLAGVGVQGRITFINVLNRSNVADWSLRFDTASSQYVRQARESVSFLPSLSLRLDL